MPLVSNLFRENKALQSCLTSDPAHVQPGAIGEHVWLIQLALEDLDQARIEGKEIAEHRYGPSTAAAVLAYKKKRNIVNYAYQTSADSIVGKMTIARLDQEMFDKQYTPRGRSKRCLRCCPMIAEAPGAGSRRR